MHLSGRNFKHVLFILVTGEENQYLHNQFGSHRVPNVNLFNFMVLLIIVINMEWL